MNFTDTEIQLTEKDIQETEARLGFPLPVPLKEHYLRFNGGTPDHAYWEYEAGEFYWLSAFLPLREEGLRDHSTWSMVKTYEELIKNKIIEDGTLPFALDWGGNYFIINSQNGEVSYFAMDVSEDRRKTLCSDFNCFMKGLKESDCQH